MQEKQRGMRFFFFSVIEYHSRAFLVHFLPLNYLLCEKLSTVHHTG